MHSPGGRGTGGRHREPSRLLQVLTLFGLFLGGAVAAAALYAALGLAYGLLAWGAARRGYLPLPEE
jgi:hypothetical protein